MQLETDHSVISAMSRSQLLDDYFELAAQSKCSILDKEALVEIQSQ